MAVVASSFLIFNAYGADFKIDLSETISKEAGAKIVDGVEKKKIALEIFRLRSLLDEFIVSGKLINPNIESTTYVDGSLAIKFKLNLEKMELEGLFKILREDPEINTVTLGDLKSKIEKVKSENFVGVDSNSSIKIPLSNYFANDVIHIGANNNYRITLLSESGEAIKSSDYYISSIVFETNKFIFVDNKEQTVNMNITAQEAAKIKSIKIIRFGHSKDTLIGQLFKYESLIKPSQLKLILSSQSSEPELAFDLAREELLLSFKNLVTMQSFLAKEKDGFLPIVTLSLGVAINLSRAAEIIALQSLAENKKITDSYAFISDFVPKLSSNNIVDVANGRYRVKYKSGIELGCQKYIPKDFKYDNPAKGFGFDGGNEVNSLMNQMGMANNSVVLGSPDQKIRVITGFISSLTENGGIISNGNTMKDANPIQFTKNAKTVIFNPEKVTVDKSLVRIVGTYDQNSKIKLTNGFGGTKVVDAANINVTCIEGMQSSDEMMQNMYKMLGIMK
jgi:hypothetical protein